MYLFNSFRNHVIKKRIFCMTTLCLFCVCLTILFKTAAEPSQCVSLVNCFSLTFGVVGIHPLARSAECRKTFFFLLRFVSVMSVSTCCESHKQKKVSFCGEVTAPCSVIARWTQSVCEWVCFSLCVCECVCIYVPIAKEQGPCRKLGAAQRAGASRMLRLCVAECSTV